MAAPPKAVRCAIYARKSTPEGLEQDFNTLDAQFESGTAYIASQHGEGWVCLPQRYEDGGYTGGNLERPGLNRLIEDIETGEIDCVVVYKVDRLSRSLLDFARLMALFDEHGVAFVSVTQQFNSATPMGRLTLNILLSFAQFEREIISERTRDKIAASRRKGKYTGGRPVLGYDLDRKPGGTRLRVNEGEAALVREIYGLYLEHHSLLGVARVLGERSLTTKQWTTRSGKAQGGMPYTKGSLHNLLTNALYLGKTPYKGDLYEGEHDAIVPHDLWRAVQVQLQRNALSGASREQNGTPRRKRNAPLQGLLRCAHCDAAMTPTYTTRGSKRYRYYVCRVAQGEGRERCPTRSVSAGEIEAFVSSQIPSRITPALRASILEQLEMTAVAQGRSESTLTSALGDFGLVWAAMTPNEQAKLLGLLIDQVVYDGTPGRQRVSITYRDLVEETAEGQAA